MLRNMACCCWGYFDSPDVGVLVATIPATGDDGASVLDNDVNRITDAGKQVRARISTPPESGTLHMNMDGSFLYSNTQAGIYTFGYEVDVDGVFIGSEKLVTVTLGVENYQGAIECTLNATAPAAQFSGDAYLIRDNQLNAVAPAPIFRATGYADQGLPTLIATLNAEAPSPVFTGYSPFTKTGEVYNPRDNLTFEIVPSDLTFELK